MLTDAIRRAPKAVLHDHLDGGLRPSTLVDLAAEYGYGGLPTTDTETLAAHIRRGADRKSLELYLETFAHTVGVMQERDAITRVAAECAEDLAADGVVYAEVRMAPELCTERGLTLDEVQAAILEGYRIGSARAEAAGTPIVVRSIVTAMRQAARSVEVAECAVRWRDAGVVGFDVAGPEKGFPPTRYLDAFDLIRRENFHITIHAGESFGLPSIWEALQFAGAERLGHGVRIVDDITVREDGSVELGRLAAFVRARDVPHLQRPHRRRRLDRGAPDRPPPAAPLPGHGQHGQPADERGHAVLGVRGARPGVRDRPRRDGVADDQRDEVGLRAVRRATAPHQRGREARLRAPSSGGIAGRRHPVITH
jgi:adenosine deaminase